MTACRAAVPLLVLYAWAAQDADRAVTRLMRGKEVRVLHRAGVSAGLDLVVVAAGAYLGPGEAVYWSAETSLGLFLQQRDNAGRIYRIAAESGPAGGGYEIRMERATPTEVVFSLTPEKGRRVPNLKFIYDPRAKALVKRLETCAFSMYRVFPAGQRAVLAGADSSRLIAVEFDPSLDPPFRVLAGAAAAAFTKRLKTSEHITELGTAQRREILILPHDPPSLRFGPENRFTLALRETQGAVPEGPALLIAEKAGAADRRFPLPQSTYDEFAAQRPARVKDGYRREHTRIAESIGPVQLAEGALWIAKSFYDSEGTTGVGGFGYFDTEARRYVLFSPPAVRAWSASSMLVEQEAAWLGLVNHSEWRGFPGGLLRFDRASRTATVLPLPDVIGDIARVGDRLILATEFGIALYDGSTIRRYFIDETTAGRLRVVEAPPSKTR
jgi:hypothetical protein